MNDTPEHRAQLYAQSKVGEQKETEVVLFDRVDLEHAYLAGYRAVRHRAIATAPQEGAHTPGPWGWVIHDHSAASLGVLPDPGLGDPLVMDVGPCRACADRAKDGDWEWGRCTTPSKADADLIAAAPDLLEALQALFFKSLAEGWIYSAEEREAAALAIEKATGQPVADGVGTVGAESRTNDKDLAVKP